MKSLYTVHHYNFGSAYHFSTLEDAKAFTLRACFDAVITLNAERVARFTSTGGWHAA